MVVGPWVLVMTLVDLHQARRRLAGFGSKASGASIFGATRWAEPLWMLFVCCLVTFDPGPVREPHLWLLSGLFILPLLGMRRRRRERQKLAPFLLSRGTLLEGLEALARKARRQRLSLYVLPDDFRPRLQGEPEPVVLIHRRFLDWMSRAEIDALAARQFARQQLEPLLPVCAVMLGCGLAAVGLCELLSVGIAGWWLVFLVLVAAETVALVQYLPHAEAQADLRAIRLTGNPDAFFSAVGESARLNGAALDLPALEKTALGAGVSADRLRALLQQQPRPAEDRYPTSGDYLTVGF